MYWLQSRYYDPEIGRFIYADGLVDSGGLLGHNMFAYCGNNPVNNFDPSGFLWEKLKDALELTVASIIYATPLGILVFAKPQKSRSSDVPYEGEPGSHAKSPDGSKERVYGPDGKPDRDRHHNDHGHPKHHPVPHDHDWGYDEKGKWQPGPAYPSPDGPLKPREPVPTPAPEFRFEMPRIPWRNPSTGDDSFWGKIIDFFS